LLWTDQRRRCCLFGRARQRRAQQCSAHAQVLYDFDFDWRYMVRGLTIDKRRGNVLKLDRHKYVKLAYHGFRPLSREERLATYANALVRARPHRDRVGLPSAARGPRDARAASPADPLWRAAAHSPDTKVAGLTG